MQYVIYICCAQHTPHLCVCMYIHVCASMYMHVCVCLCVGGVHACLQGAGDCLHCHTLPRPTVSIHKEGWVDRTARLHRERRGGEGRGGEGREVEGMGEEGRKER